MTAEEAIKILDHKTYSDAISEIEYYAGFNGQDAKAAAVLEACTMAIAALRAQQTPSGEDTAIVRCKDCKRLYYKDMSGYCPHRVGPCCPYGFCDRGERRKGN